MKELQRHNDLSVPALWEPYMHVILGLDQQIPALDDELIGEWKGASLDYLSLCRYVIIFV